MTADDVYLSIRDGISREPAHVYIRTQFLVWYERRASHLTTRFALAGLVRDGWLRQHTVGPKGQSFSVFVSPRFRNCRRAVARLSDLWGWYTSYDIQAAAGAHAEEQVVTAFKEAGFTLVGRHERAIQDVTTEDRVGMPDYVFSRNDSLAVVEVKNTFGYPRNASLSAKYRYAKERDSRVYVGRVHSDVDWAFDHTALAGDVYLALPYKIHPPDHALLVDDVREEMWLPVDVTDVWTDLRDGLECLWPRRYGGSSEDVLRDLGLLDG